MIKDVWLPQGFELPQGVRVKRVLYSSDSWQIYKTSSANFALVAEKGLSDKWIDAQLLEADLLLEFRYGEMSLTSICSENSYVLAPVGEGKPSHQKTDVLSFAVAIRESRRVDSDSSFHDAIYMEKYSRLLPTWTVTPRTEDSVVLGKWVSGGVEVSTDSFRRLSKLTGWMPASDLVDVIGAAGLPLPNDAAYVSGQSNADAGRDKPATTTEKSRLDDSIDERRSRGLFSLPGRPHLENFFNEHIVDIIFNAEKYQAMGIEFPSAIVLHGPPGCGKTYAVEKLIEFIDWPSYSIDSSSVGSPYIHETSKKISEVFDKAIEDAPSVLVIDEMESFLTDRNDSTSSGLHHVEEVAEFLRRIPGAVSKKVLIIAMTNLIERIDPAILRRGRFDHIIEVGMPSAEEVESLLKSLLAKVPTDHSVDIVNLVARLEGRALSDAAFVVRESARLAAKSSRSEIDQDCLETALESLPDDKAAERRPIGFIWDE